jgi:hypothetical protein
MAAGLSIFGSFVGGIGCIALVAADFYRHIRAHPKTNAAGITHGRVNLVDVGIALVI